MIEFPKQANKNPNERESVLMKPRHLPGRDASLFVSRRELSLLRLHSQVLMDRLHNMLSRLP
jgi:hypothetical protein